MAVAALIPAYQPEQRLVGLVARLSQSALDAVIVVDDGSSPDREPHFAAIAGLPKVHLVRHAVNLGKGAALRTGLNYACCQFPALSGVVTADADGQHAVDDILAVAGVLEAHPDALVLGCRAFHGEVPWRSRVGNRLSVAAVRALVGQHISDTQTGLRGIPRALAAPLLRLSSSGYEFELDMLIACKHLGVEIIEQPIATIYLDGNRGSHFNPLFDSMRIYFTLLRFTTVSLATALVDNVVFWAVLQSFGHIAAAQLAGRLVALAFNYSAVRRAVFFSREGHARVLPRYLALVAASGLASYGLIQALHLFVGLEVMPAKLVAESLIFIANFALQRDFVFTRREPATARRTDWDRYYQHTASTARLTRRYTTRRLIDGLRRFGPAAGQANMVELGGANSCFLDAIVHALRPVAYHVIDSNRGGLDLLAQRPDVGTRLELDCADVLDLPARPESDIAYSVGLIEHFDPDGTRRAVEAHFARLRPGGTALIAFPTPTWLYRATRALLELAGLWGFPDERPLGRAEVLSAASPHGELLHEETLWPLILTQHLMVFRKR